MQSAEFDWIDFGFGFYSPSNHKKKENDILLALY